jgi:hypothetical protein
LVQGLECFVVSLDAAAGLEDLGFSFKQDGAHLSFGQTAAQVKEGAMLFPLAAMAVSTATFEETLQEGGTDQVRGQLEGLEEVGLALAQSQSGKALEFSLTHIMSKIAGPVASASENENNPRMRKCLPAALSSSHYEDCR